MRALLDSNAYSYLARGGHAVAEIVRTADEVLLSVIVMGETVIWISDGVTVREQRHRAKHIPGP